ncbi:archaeal flagellin n-terminal-like domain-containing protein [Colletotrichum plurivorum]|uniref:Archaeal flagellin n-terminal-like domain-containing protein n=1 Tax=Colletotrichum plurivorum TaxID=2175906 RepID=A0A8H6K9X9_9PEZI|nr:archaeal flagellin n-terminal-like domain-containing protein [Colletotrichum plurivorum]
MAHFPTPKAVTIITTGWLLILTSGAVLAASMHLRINIQGRRLLTSDMFLCLAWCSAVATASFDIQFTAMGVLKQHIKITLDGYDGTDDDIMSVMRLFWASSIPFFTTFYLCKAALLAVYVQLFPVFMHYRRMLVWATVVYIGIAYLTSMILLFTICLPLSKNWEVTDRVDATDAVMCSASAPALVFQVGWALHFFGDILVFTLPWLILPDLKIRRTLKIGVYCTFALGIINMTFSLVRFITIQTATVDDLPFGLVQLWSELDVNIGLLVATLPSLRPYFRSNRNAGSSDKSKNRYNCKSTIKTPMRTSYMAGFNIPTIPATRASVDLEQAAVTSSAQSQKSDLEE